MSKYKIKITGKNPNYFVRELIKRKINIYDLKAKSKEVYIIIDINDYSKIKEIKTSYKIEIVERIGPTKYKYLIKKNYIFCLFFLGAIFLNIFLSNIIFSVDIVHTNKDIIDIIKNDLDYYGLKKYHFVMSYEKCEKLVKKILKKEANDIEWLEIERQGTKYIVQIEQRKKNKPVNNCQARNIVAKKAARILEIKATSGEVVVKINDYVEKNATLISGFIHNKETIVSKRCAEGDVYGEVWYKVNLDFPVKYKEVIKTNNERYGFFINIFSRKINLFNKYKTYVKKDIPLISNSLLPVNINFTKYIETKVTNKDYNLKDIDKEALEKAEKTLKDELDEDATIISKKVLKKVKNNSRIVVEVFVKVKENITDYQDISKITIEDMEKRQEEKE